MSGVDFKLSDSLLSYDIHLSRRINFIRGDSGTGKTTMVDLLREASEVDNVDVDLELHGVSGVVILSEDSYASVIKDSRNKLVVLDDLGIANKGGFASLVKRYCIANDLWFLIISRYLNQGVDYMKSLSYSINSVYKLCNMNNVYSLASYYDYGFCLNRQYDAVVTEDKGSRCNFFVNLFKCDVFPSTSGKSTIVRDVEELRLKGYSNILVLMDTASFGCHMEEFDMYFSGYDDFNVSLISFYECFEELLIHSPFADSPVVHSELEKLGEYANNFISWERYFEDLMERATDGKYYSYKHGSPLRNCFLKSCDLCDSYRRGRCDCASSGDKYEYLLRGTKYEFLLNIV